MLILDSYPRSKCNSKMQISRETETVAHSCASQGAGSCIRLHKLVGEVHRRALNCAASPRLATNRRVAPAARFPRAMLLPLPELPDAWDALRGVGSLPNVPAGSSGPVLIFVAVDPDSVAAVRTLTALLKADVVRYEVHPVSGFAHLVDVFDVLAKGENAVAPRAVLCVNCGANVNLEKILGIADMQSPPPVYVMDSHRPFHLKNIASEAVVLFDDDESFDHAGLPMDMGWEDEWGNVSDHEFSDGDSDDSESDDGSGDSESERSVDSDGNISSDESDGEGGEDDAGDAKTADGESAADPGRENSTTSDLAPSATGSVSKRTHSESSAGHSSKRRRSDESGEHQSTGAGDRRRRRRRKRKGPQNAMESSEKDALREYYAQTSLATSSACLSHNLASTLRRSNTDTLWMAIVGVTSQFLSAGVTADLYDNLMAYFRGQAAALAPAATNASVTEGTSVEAGGYSAAACRELAALKVAPSTELRLDLVRHWTLYESLLYSSYTVARLGAWRQTGRRRLQELLATLGIPLKESKQRWCFMKAECKQALDDRLAAVIRRFDLGKSIQYESFVRAMPGHRGAVSAADCVFAISSLLELDAEGAAPSAVGPLQERFWRAYDALDPGRGAALDAGLDMAIVAQKLAAGIGGDVIERRKFVPSGPFRYVFLRDQQCKEMLVKPLLLKRLALFLIAALARQGAKDKPFVVLAPDAERGTWLAVAATSVGRTNDFGVRFQKAAEKNGSQIVYSGFDSAVCEIRDGQEVEFVRFLHDVMR